MRRFTDCIGCNWIRRERGEDQLPEFCQECEDLKTEEEKLIEALKLRRVPNPDWAEGAKRQRIPITIKWTCPICGYACSRDLTDWHLSYPKLSPANGDAQLGWDDWYVCCDNEDCGTEITCLELKVEVDLKVRWREGAEPSESFPYGVGTVVAATKRLVESETSKGDTNVAIDEERPWVTPDDFIHAEYGDRGKIFGVTKGGKVRVRFDKTGTTKLVREGEIVKVVDP